MGSVRGFEFGVEGIVGFFLTDGGEWAVAWDDDGVVLEGEEFLAVGFEGAVP